MALALPSPVADAQLTAYRLPQALVVDTRLTAYRLPAPFWIGRFNRLLICARLTAALFNMTSARLGINSTANLVLFITNTVSNSFSTRVSTRAFCKLVTVASVQKAALR